MSKDYSLLDEGGWTPVTVTVRFEPGFTYCYGHVPLAMGRGFIDASSGVFLLGGDFRTGIVNIRNMHFEWPRVERLQDVPIKPVLQFDTPCLFREPQTPLEAVSIERSMNLNGSLS